MTTTNESDGPPITTFTVINFTLAGISALGLILLVLVAVYGIFYSGDEGAELAAGIFGSVFLGFFPVVGLCCYLTAGIGLAKRARWGYYFHIAGAILAATSCIGAVYTAFALIYAFKPKFKQAFD